MTVHGLQPGAKAPIIAASELIAAVVDPGSYESWDRPPLHACHGAGYLEALESASQRSGTDEAVLTGVGTIEGRTVVVIAGEFAFLGGSIGLATASRIIGALERATAEGLPVVASPSSGGTRMQEGTPAFLAMALIASAVESHKSAGNPYLVYLRHPTTGGAMASWGSLGHVTFAQPGALLGFLGPRVYESLHGEPFPSGVQMAENLARHGVVDAVVPVDGLRSVLVASLRYGHQNAAPDAGADSPHASAALRNLFAARSPEVHQDTAWDVVLRSRDTNRPGLRELLSAAAHDVVLLDRGPITVALASVGEVRCVVVGQDRREQYTGRLIGPRHLAAARRGMRLAEQLGLPLLTVIDTPGAELSPDAEQGGLAREIARCLALLPTLSVPTLAFIAGEGTGGAAIALIPADKIMCAQHAWLAPLAPEGASAILHRDSSRASELARSLRITADDLVACGAVSTVVAEKPDAAAEPTEFCRRAGLMIEENFLDLLTLRRGDHAAVAAVGLA
ncbi:carboxyl transferase domain-containing protein [Paenarthrobacter ilicis]|uniref:Acetyl-CoA carboxylase carboxyl transferase subunit beta n=1 Tax=Paenarthrobacter ilicis TaxID=43665 RepID=A0ABX0TLW9_9MICC|nr:carboxyl transferase domain-containing protein [Paenarthrobacter ilicis]MBM7793103.1 acetyl-CoA carboxylase carboxyl transferase subunit beta [Paenarthrobacter ilicis]NIJ02121.1 acetyl-CoA carboxylase carboxyl transferase subunit beta [Paenarthrobacter ilicis]